MGEGEGDRGESEEGEGGEGLTKPANLKSRTRKVGLSVPRIFDKKRSTV